MAALAATNELKTIRLYGVLGARFGREFRLAVKSTGEAARALCAVVPGFRQFLVDSKAKGMNFACFIGKRNIGRDDLEDPAGRNEIRFAPIIQGAKKGGIFQVIAGAVLAVVGAVAMYFGQPWGATLIKAGAMLALGGVVQMLSPQAAGLKSVDNGKSDYFDGPVNSSAQGECVNLVYGEIMAGSKICSSGIYTEDKQ